MGGTQIIEAGQHVKEAYTPYAMSTIVDRALPDVKDGFKPIHRRILFSSYKAGITHEKDRSKTGELVSETMKIHHHGNTSVEEAIALMTEQNESQLHPYIDGEGAFGKCYSTDHPAPPRYTYCRLNKFSEEFFIDYNKNILTMIGEDKTHLQPVTLSSSFPNILIKTNTGIACGESCSFPSFNLIEVCNATEAYINNKNIDLLDYLSSPDFSSKGYIIYDKKNLKQIYDTGKGSITLKSKYKYDETNNCIEIFEIPYNTTADAIILKINNLLKKNNINILKSITDIRDETGFNKNTQKEELKITIDVKKNTNIKTLMNVLFKRTQLQSIFSVNMNCLVDCKPKVLGIKQILDEWLNFRTYCITKSLNYDLNKKKKELHLLQGLKQILLNVDKAIDIIKNSKETDIINNLCTEFKIDNIQAQEIVNMKLIKINKDYIIKQIQDIETLEKDINTIENTINNESAIDNIIIKDLERIKKTYGKPRQTEIIYEDDIQDINTSEQLIEEYSTYCTLSEQGYFHKLLKKSDNIKSKDDDKIIKETYSNNKSTLLLFSNTGNCYKLYEYELQDDKPSNLGQYLPTLLQLEEDEQIINMVSVDDDYKGNLIEIFENGKIANIELSAFKTETKRSKLKNSLCLKNGKLLNMFIINKDVDIILQSSLNKVLITNTSYINSKASKSANGNQIMKSKKDSKVIFAEQLQNINTELIQDIEYYKNKNGTGIGVYLKEGDNIELK